jgi:hypothetical protein
MSVKCAARNGGDTIGGRRQRQRIRPTRRPTDADESIDAEVVGNCQSLLDPSTDCAARIGRRSPVPRSVDANESKPGALGSVGDEVGLVTAPGSPWYHSTGQVRRPVVGNANRASVGERDLAFLHGALRYLRRPTLRPRSIVHGPSKEWRAGQAAFATVNLGVRFGALPPYALRGSRWIGRERVESAPGRTRTCDPRLRSSQGGGNRGQR